MLKEHVAEVMEELGIYAKEFVEFSSRFRDRDAETHGHPSIQVISLFASAAKRRECGLTSFVKSVED